MGGGVAVAIRRTDVGSRRLCALRKKAGLTAEESEPAVIPQAIIDGHWDARSVFVQLVTKIDEAGTHGESSYMTMAGYSARLGQWSHFDRKWTKKLHKAGLRYFHVKEHGNHPFALTAAKIADDKLMFGFVVRLDKSDYDKYYREGRWGGKAQPDSMYGLCFRYCLSLVLKVALEEMPHDGLILNFIVEDGHENSGAPTEIVRQLKQKRISGVSEFLGTAVPGEKKKVPGLQAADGLASGAWHLEALGMPQLGPPQEPSLASGRAIQQTTATSMKTPLFRCHIDAEHLTNFKEGYFAHIEYRRQWGQRRANDIAAAKTSSEREQPS